MSEFIEQAKARYEELLKQKQVVDKELVPLKQYLENVGALTKQRRARRKKGEQN